MEIGASRGYSSPLDGVLDSTIETGISKNNKPVTMIDIVNNVTKELGDIYNLNKDLIYDRIEALKQAGNIEEYITNSGVPGFRLNKLDMVEAQKLDLEKVLSGIRDFTNLAPDKATEDNICLYIFDNRDQYGISNKVKQQDVDNYVHDILPKYFESKPGISSDEAFRLWREKEKPQSRLGSWNDVINQ